MSEINEQKNQQYNDAISKAKSTSATGLNNIKKVINPFRFVRKNKEKGPVKFFKKMVKTTVKIVKNIIKVLGTKATIAITVSLASLAIIGGTLLEEQDVAPASGQFASGINNNTIEIDENGQVIVKDISLENKFLIAFYQYYAKRSVYILCEDEGIFEPMQWNSKDYEQFSKEKKKEGILFKDKYDRESKFAMNYNSLYVLDKYLNNGKYFYPDQIIKPVSYTTDIDGTYNLEPIALPEDDDEENGDRYLNAFSAKYEKNKTTGEYIRYDNSQTLGVWDYGFGSILNYKKYTEKSKDIGTCTHLSVWNPNHETLDESGQVKSYGGLETWTIEQYNNFQNDESIENKDKYIFGINSEDELEYEGAEEVTGTSYMIDWVLAPCGKISNPIDDTTWKDTGENIIHDTKIKKTVKKRVLVEQPTPTPIPTQNPTSDQNADIVVPDVNINDTPDDVFIIDGGFNNKDIFSFNNPTPSPTPNKDLDVTINDGSSQNIATFPTIEPQKPLVPKYKNVEVEVEFTVTYSGTKYKCEPTYIGEPNLEDFVGIDYYKDYLNYYSTYIPEDVIKKFDYKALERKAKEFDSKYNTNIQELLKRQEIDDYISSITKIANEGTTEEEAAGTSEKGQKIYDKYKQYIDVASAYYGIDPRFITAIIGVESGGNTESKNTKSTATGLMQVIASYYTGKTKSDFNPVKVSGQTKIKMTINEREDICNPETGIMLGVEVLREKLLTGAYKNWTGATPKGDTLEGFNLFTGLAYYGPTGGKMNEAFWNSYIEKEGHCLKLYYDKDLTVSTELNLDGLQYGTKPSEDAISIWKTAIEHSAEYPGLPWAVNDSVSNGEFVKIHYFNWDGTIAGTVDTTYKCTRTSSSGNSGQSQNGNTQSVSSNLGSNLGSTISELSNYIPALLYGDTESDENPFLNEKVPFEDRIPGNNNRVYKTYYMHEIKKDAEQNEVLKAMFAYQEGKRISTYKEITDETLRDYYTLLFANIGSSYNQSTVNHDESLKYFPSGYTSPFSTNELLIENAYPNEINGISVVVGKVSIIKSMADYGRVVEIGEKSEYGGKYIIIDYDILNANENEELKKKTRVIFGGLSKILVEQNQNIARGDKVARLTSNNIEILIQLQQSSDGVNWISRDPTWMVTGCSSYPTTGLAVPIYYQQDYAHLPYGYDGNTVASAGCGLTSCCMAMSYFTGTKITPVEMLNSGWCTATNHYVRGVGSSSTLYPDAVKNYTGPNGEKINCKSVSRDEVISELAAGHLVICSQNSYGKFTSGGHIILLRGTVDNKILINDPNKNNVQNPAIFTNGIDTAFEQSDVLGRSFNYAFSLWIE